MRGRAHVVAERDGRGRTRLLTCGGTPPVTPRATGPHTVHLVSTAGGPLPGDRAEVRIEVGPGAYLEVRSSAATVALASPLAGVPASRWRVRADVAAGGTLVMLGEPLVAARGCDHLLDTVITLHGDARLIWRDLLVPGRTGEPPGDVSVALRVTRDDHPVLAQTLAIGPRAPGWDRVAVLGSARCLGSLLLAGPEHWRPERTRWAGEQAAFMPLAARGAALGTALGEAPDVRAHLSAWLPAAIDG